MIVNLLRLRCCLLTDEKWRLRLNIYVLLNIVRIAGSDCHLIDLCLLLLTLGLLLNHDLL